MERRISLQSKKNNNSKRRRRSGEEVNWLDLPSEVMLVILSKLDVFQILCYAQFVCSSWLQLAKDPFLYRSILVPYVLSISHGSNRSCSLHSHKGLGLVLRVLKDAAKRSSTGDLKEISLAKSWCNDVILIRVLKYMTGTTNLKSLRLASFRGFADHLLIASAFQRLPFLEELELKDEAFSTASGNIIRIAGRSCPRLKYFSFINNTGDMHSYIYYDQVAFAIAHCMPHLRGLRLYITCLINTGLRAIIKGCPHLENLDLRGCCYNDLQEDLQKQCLNKIRDISFPSSNVAPPTPLCMLKRIDVRCCHLVMERNMQ
ncbi:hypothetical protein IFM89_027051 [Coptis chinensis]|uniref:F-box domain-containing protein n=1 Tax=Coptis chinensis TaxID=261450 RepID=A0A835LNZ3_9MAGN|nr:hypothetical protein IFM89_027051 [Coptis chinensis]